MSTVISDPVSDSSTQERLPVLVVGIGASAGGLESLKVLLPLLPHRARIAYVVLQHLAPTHRSMMAEILASRTQMPVRELRDGDALMPNEVLITPPNAHVEYDGNRLRLQVPDPHSLPRPSINLFFGSLAKTVPQMAVGVILSGTGSDGALGLRQLCAAGGHAIVQPPQTARYNGMPEAAIRAVGHDAAIPIERMGAAIADVVDEISGARFVEAPLLSAELPPDQLSDLIARIRRHVNIDFAEYKEGTLMRRIARRMAARQCDNLGDYIAYCDENPEELDSLARDTLISVTSFWRDREAFTALSHRINDMLDKKDAGEAIRVWVPGCATGEEVYSIMMAIAQHLGNRLIDRQMQIFATDLDTDALSIARRGLYSPNSLADLPEELVREFFTPFGSQYEFSRMLRERIVFSRHDVTRDPPFPRLDLVSCRNLLIYLKPESQARVMRAFHYALRRGGLLFLGRSESVLHHEALFNVLDKEARIYERGDGRSTHGTDPFDLPSSRSPTPIPSRRTGSLDPELQLLQQAAEHYVPNCVLLDEKLQIVHVHGDVTKFMSLKPGLQSFDVLSLIRSEFESDLRLMCAMLPDATQIQQADITLRHGKTREVWRMILHPLASVHGRKRSLLAFIALPKRLRTATTPATISAEPSTELQETRDRLKVLVEQLEASNEEMQALNEEAQAANEELQSSNEELEAANEEMQATNQELATVNAELNHQWRRHQQLSEELQSIQNSIDLPLLVLDEQHSIRRFNKAAAQLFRLSDGCEGMHVSTIYRPDGMPDLLDAVQRAQSSASTMVVHLPQTLDGREFVMHLAHNVLGGERRGIVLTLVDNTQLARAERQTRNFEQRLAAISSRGGALVAIKDASGRYEFANERYADFFKLAAGEIAGRTDNQLLPQALATTLRSADIEAMRDVHPVERTETLTVGDVPHHWWVCRTAMRDDEGAVLAISVQAVDLTRQQNAAEELRIAAKVLDSTTEGVVITDAQKRILQINRAFTQICGYRLEEVVGKSPGVLSSGRHSDPFYAEINRSLATQGSWQGEIWNRRKSGEVYPQWLSITVLRDDDGNITHYVGVFSDISALVASRDRIEELASQDPLTGLPNRNLLLDRLDHALRTAQRQTTELAICFIDLDNFKTVNDSLGHDVGDEVLRQAARRISENVRTADTLARLGGDEFILLLEDTNRHECLQTIERIVRALNQNLTLRDNLLSTAASIGIAFYPGDGQDSAELMRCADAAMYRAKRGGRGRYEFFSTEVGESARSRMQIESGLRQALENGELQLHYQPQIDISSGRIFGAEALLRWQTAAGAWIAPSTFLPIAEETSLIHSIGDWVIDTGCAQLARWRSQGLNDINLSVNVSPKQLLDRGFVDRLQGILIRHQVPAARVVLEMTEGVLLRIDQALPILRRIDSLEVQLSLDDFGTGFSSLAMLRQLPLREVKIDRSFIQGIADRADDREIVGAVVGLALALGLRVVAEGVETSIQVEHLKQFVKVPVIQGFHFSPAIRGDELPDWVRASEPGFLP